VTVENQAARGHNQPLAGRAKSRMLE